MEIRISAGFVKTNALTEGDNFSAFGVVTMRYVVVYAFYYFHIPALLPKKFPDATLNT